MKKTLLFIALIASSSFFAQTELVKNGTCDEHGTGSDTSNTSDNADAWDMTPNSTLNGGITSPYRFDATNNPNGWRNDALETALEIKYLGAEGSLDEQPGSTSSGNNGTRGVKLYDDGSPSITGSSRRLYQRVVGLTIGDTYNFSIDSRSEAENTPTEVYILNNEIQNENGIDANKYSDASVTAGMDITVASANVGNWETKTLSFVATTTEVVIYIRSLSSVDEDTEVFYDNISLKKATTASTADIFASSVKVFPNPASDILTISANQSIEKAEIFNTLGKRVLSSNTKSINISSLAKGFYIVKITSGNSVATRKIIKD